jgi:hypothetical protein
MTAWIAGIGLRGNHNGMLWVSDLPPAALLVSQRRGCPRLPPRVGGAPGLLGSIVPLRQDISRPAAKGPWSSSVGVRRTGESLCTMS